MSEYVQLFLDYLKDVRGLSSSTVGAYHSDLRHFHNLALDRGDENGNRVYKPIEEVNKIDVQKFIKAMKDRGLAPRTINRRLDCLATFWLFLLEELELDIKSPLKKDYKQKTKDTSTSRRRTITPEEARKCIEDAQESDPTTFLILILMGKQGLRIGEVRRLLLEQIDRDAQTLTVKGSKSEDRILPLAVSVLEAIDAHCGGRVAGPVVTWDEKATLGFSSNTGLWVRVRAIMDKHGVEGTPHSWRRMFGTQVYHSSKDIVKAQELLGHASIETTRQSYVVSKEEREKDAKLIDDIF